MARLQKPPPKPLPKPLPEQLPSKQQLPPTQPRRQQGSGPLLSPLFLQSRQQQQQKHMKPPLRLQLYLPILLVGTFFGRERISIQAPKHRINSRQEFNAIVIKKVEQKVSAKGYNTVLQSSLATIKCAGTAADSISNIEDDEEWEAINEVATSWIREKRKNVAVTIQLTWNARQEEESFFDDSELLCVSRKRRRHESITSTTESSLFLPLLSLCASYMV